MPNTIGKMHMNSRLAKEAPSYCWSGKVHAMANGKSVGKANTIGLLVGKGSWQSRRIVVRQRYRPRTVSREKLITENRSGKVCRTTNRKLVGNVSYSRPTVGR